MVPDKEPVSLWLGDPVLGDVTVAVIVSEPKANLIHQRRTIYIRLADFETLFESVGVEVEVIEEDILIESDTLADSETLSVSISVEVEVIEGDILIDLLILSESTRVFCESWAILIVID
eukprot:gene417-biopygen9060